MKTSEDLINSFIDHYWLSYGASENTLKSYRSDLKIFSNWCNNDLTNLTQSRYKNIFKLETMRTYLKVLNQGFSPALELLQIPVSEKIYFY